MVIRRQAWVRAALGVAVCALAMAARAEDWPQWRGPQRNGISAEAFRWPAGGPKRVWTAQVGEGFSAVAVKNGRVYTVGNRDGSDTILCLNATNGQPIWRYSYRCSSGDYGGPRATPVLDGNNVYTMSRDGVAYCLNATTGQRVWVVDVRQHVNAQTPQWGFAGSPLIEGNLALYNVGTAGVALNKANGNLVWGSGPKNAGYASPVAFSMGGKRGVAFFVGWGIVAVNPADGRPLWQYRWETNYDVNAADPIVTGDTVFISSNYNRGAALLRVGSGRPSAVWENRNMRNHFNTCVLVNGFLYGNDENTLKCIDLKSGGERWSLRGIGKGGLITTSGVLIVLSERGELFAANASPDRYTELGRTKVLDGTCWTHPVLANGFLYCRSHEGALVCLDARSR